MSTFCLVSRYISLCWTNSVFLVVTMACDISQCCVYIVKCLQQRVNTIESSSSWKMRSFLRRCLAALSELFISSCEKSRQATRRKDLQVTNCQ